MKNIWQLAFIELKALLRSPLAWISLGIVIALSTWYFLNIIEHYQEIAHELMNRPRSPGVTAYVISPFYINISLFFLMIVPIYALFSIQRERLANSKRMLLLETAPLSHRQIIVGKYLGLSIFLIFITLLISALPFSLRLGADIDISVFFLSALGFWLLLCSFAAISFYLSLISKEAVIAICLSYGVLFLLRMLDWGVTQSSNEISTLEYLSSFKHFEVFTRGIFSLQSIAYFILCISLFLVLSIRHLDQQRSKV